MVNSQRFLHLFYGSQTVGQLFANTGSTEFSFKYEQAWLNNGFALSPKLPLNGQFSNTDVTYFFQNLLPEGANLDEIALSLRISKSEKFEILKQIGADASGAFVLAVNQPVDITSYDRPLPLAELSKRIALRERRNFAVWDKKVRVSVAGFQDKIGIKVKNEQWFLPEGSFNHTSHILKPPPVNSQFESMVVNEAFCMQLSQKIGLPTANTKIVEVPEPVLLIERFDRTLKQNILQNNLTDNPNKTRYHKLHVIDGCQLLGLPANFKMERPYGASNDVEQIREGASIAKLAQAIRDYSSTPIIDIKHFLEWIAFQLCIGNVDAHAKNLSFFVNAKSKIRLAPFYDQVCILDFGQLEERLSFNSDLLDTDLAMAIGDEFDITKIMPYDIALMAKEAGFPIKAVVTTFTNIAHSVLEQLESITVKDNYQRFTSIKQIIHILSQQLLTTLPQAEQAFKDLD